MTVIRCPETDKKPLSVVWFACVPYFSYTHMEEAKAEGERLGLFQSAMKRLLAVIIVAEKGINVKERL